MDNDWRGLGLGFTQLNHNQSIAMNFKGGNNIDGNVEMTRVTSS